MQLIQLNRVETHVGPPPRISYTSTQSPIPPFLGHSLITLKQALRQLDAQMGYLSQRPSSFKNSLSTLSKQ